MSETSWHLACSQWLHRSQIRPFSPLSTGSLQSLHGASASTSSASVFFVCLVPLSAWLPRLPLSLGCDMFWLGSLTWLVASPFEISPVLFLCRLLWRFYQLGEDGLSRSADDLFTPQAFQCAVSVDTVIHPCECVPSVHGSFCPVFAPPLHTNCAWGFFEVYLCGPKCVLFFNERIQVAKIVIQQLLLLLLPDLPIAIIAVRVLF